MIELYANAWRGLSDLVEEIKTTIHKRIDELEKELANSNSPEDEENENSETKELYVLFDCIDSSIKLIQDDIAIKKVANLREYFDNLFEQLSETGVKVTDYSEEIDEVLDILEKQK